MTDYTKVGAEGMSSKLQKAMDLKQIGAAIEIIDESDFSEWPNLLLSPDQDLMLRGQSTRPRPKRQ